MKHQYLISALIFVLLAMPGQQVQGQQAPGYLPPGSADASENAGAKAREASNDQDTIRHRVDPQQQTINFGGHFYRFDFEHAAQGRPLVTYPGFQPLHWW